MKYSINWFGFILFGVYAFVLNKVWGTPCVWVMLYIALSGISFTTTHTKRK